MGEIKSVKVDNWGVFFLQKLQNFFNKTDYCDMTLQFNDNSQLKVHRLVLSACTDYFNLLETNCELVDDALVMPNDLQADVVVPIVNFMYTGTLEFELNMYNKLLRTARDMNMTVLLKLLEAHRRTMEQTSTLTKPQPASQIRGRPYPTTLSPIKQVTVQRGTSSTQAPGGRIITSNIGRRPAPTQRGNIAIKEEVSFDPSPFEQLRQSGINYKRPASKAYETPPEKKPSMEDVKEFAEQQRMRKQIAAEASSVPGEDEYVESYMEDEFPQDDEEEDVNISGSQITIKQEPNQKPTIVFKASADSKMDHAKIIGEVLKKYPHLIKNNKNLKLKIMPNSGTSQQQKIIVKKEDVQVSQQVSQKPVVQPTFRSSTNTSSQKPAGQPKKIDSKTMHSLIALGAENTTGPWLCLRCGVNGRPISIPSYRGFRRHLINTHKEKIDQKLCEHCGYRSADLRDLHFHVQVEHQITSTAFTFPRCEYCAQFFVTSAVLHKHIEESHTKNQQCIYCNEVYPKENDLYNHMKIAHKKQAQSDGVIDFSDGEEVEDENEFLTFNKVEDSKIKILSDISLPTTSVAVNEGTKFVTADGSEMVLSEEQRDQLMAQLDPNQEGGGIIMVLNESFSVSSEQQQSDESVAIVSDHAQVQEPRVKEKFEDDNMFAYKEMDAEEEQLESKVVEEEEEIDSGKHDDEKKEIEENMDADEPEEEKHCEKNTTSEDEKLKMITGEWTDDEPEETEEENNADDSKLDKTINEEESIEEKLDETSNKDQMEDDSKDDPDEEKVNDSTDGEHLTSPLKQELMEFLGMDNIDDSILEDKDSEIKEETKNIESQQKEDGIKEEQVKKEVEQEIESLEEKSVTEEVEDELAQLREEMKNNEKENVVENVEEKPVQEAEMQEMSDSELQEQLENEEKIYVAVAEPEKEDKDIKTEIQPEEIENSEKVSQDQSKDALKSIITDWADEGEGNDDDL